MKIVLPEEDENRCYWGRHCRHELRHRPDPSRPCGHPVCASPRPAWHGGGTVLWPKDYECHLPTVAAWQQKEFSYLNTSTSQPSSLRNEHFHPPIDFPAFGVVAAILVGVICLWPVLAVTHGVDPGGADATLDERRLYRIGTSLRQLSVVSSIALAVGMPGHLYRFVAAPNQVSQLNQRRRRIRASWPCRSRTIHRRADQQYCPLHLPSSGVPP